MRLPFLHSAPERTLRKPAPTNMPTLERANVAALYCAARFGGDFFDFKQVEKHLVLVMMDIAGRREEALDIAAAAQERFHEEAGKLFGDCCINEAEALNALSIALNRNIMETANGVRHSPAFVACYDEAIGTLFYVNAGHTPALLRDEQGVTLLEASGIPFGLFTHATPDAQACVLQPGAAVLLASRGLIESRNRKHDFGLERLRETVSNAKFKDASELCSGVLTAVKQFTDNHPGQNDVTTLALMRSTAMATSAGLP
ncbi:MAG TPA: SpoIIE family protein phosphatase [Terriglobales bacterium]|nr:SpoIIE family protein phosphatase [Terriglobales bacterium]